MMKPIGAVAFVMSASIASAASRALALARRRFEADILVNMNR